MTAGDEVKEMDCLILCGGFGRRLRDIVTDRPKPMAEVGGRPFLEILTGYFSSLGVRRFVFCSGYKGQWIREYFHAKWRQGSISFSHENRPMGTGGAVKHAEGQIHSNPFMVVNGDSICRFEAAHFLEFHHRAKALASIALVRADGCRDGGVVQTAESGRVLAFDEKAPKSGPCRVNAGVYLFDRRALSTMPSEIKFSLEYDWFPRFCGRGVYGWEGATDLFDIGTPERLRRARNQGLCARSGDGYGL